MSTETIIEVNSVRDKATFTHGEVAEGAFVRDKALRTHRVGCQRRWCAIRGVVRTGKGKEARVVLRA